MNKKEEIIYGENKKYGVIMSYTKVRMPYEKEEVEKAIYDPFVVINENIILIPVYNILNAVDKEKMLIVAKENYKCSLMK